MAWEGFVDVDADVEKSVAGFLLGRIVSRGVAWEGVVDVDADVEQSVAGFLLGRTVSR